MEPATSSFGDISQNREAPYPRQQAHMDDGSPRALHITIQLTDPALPSCWTKKRVGDLDVKGGLGMTNEQLVPFFPSRPSLKPVPQDGPVWFPDTTLRTFEEITAGIDGLSPCLTPARTRHSPSAPQLVKSAGSSDSFSILKDL